IGPKIAGELLRKYETLEGVFEHLDEISGAKRKENLRNGQKQALISRRLVRLDDDVDVEIHWPSGRVGGIRRDDALELCREFGFRRLTERLEGLSVADAPGEWRTKYQVVATVEALQALAAKLAEQP